MSSGLLHTAIEECIPFIEQHPENFEPETNKLLNTTSSATIDRKLEPYRESPMGALSQVLF